MPRYELYSAIKLSGRSETVSALDRMVTAVSARKLVATDAEIGLKLSEFH
jgi:hypothetical protein